MNQLSVPVRFLPVKSFFLSLVVHLIVLNAFMFTFPSLSTSFKPTFIFLGSILKDQDVGDVLEKGAGGGERLPLAKDSPESVSGELFRSFAETGRRFIQGVDHKPVSPKIVGSREKIVTKSLFNLPEEIKQLPAQSVEDHTEAKYEIEPYKPLGLFPGEPR